MSDWDTTYSPSGDAANMRSASDGHQQRDLNGSTGPTLGSAHFDEQPKPLPACATCPKAMWYRTSRQGLRAFCRELRMITWHQGENDPVIECDGQQAALLGG